jgi:hypothetical protein
MARSHRIGQAPAGGGHDLHETARAHMRRDARLEHGFLSDQGRRHERVEPPVPGLLGDERAIRERVEDAQQTSIRLCRPEPQADPDRPLGVSPLRQRLGQGVQRGAVAPRARHDPIHLRRGFVRIAGSPEQVDALHPPGHGAAGRGLSPGLDPMGSGQNGSPSRSLARSA